MDKIIGREQERAELGRLFETKEAEFIAVYGRRRVGKTFLINSFFRKKGLFFEVTGQYKASIKDQLYNFTAAVTDTFHRSSGLPTPANWREAFAILREAVQGRGAKRKVILFFDELPWLASRRSGFVSALEYFWNTWASRQRHIKLIVCGSAASWIIQNIVNSKGGLHNRITSSIRLLPFTLMESRKYLFSRGIKLNNRQILDLYMVMGGIPFYLKQVKQGKSAAQNINSICFRKDGVLTREFDRLYDSLFDNSQLHKKIVTRLAASRKGLPHNELTEELGLTAGGTLNRALTNLQEAGFISRWASFDRRLKGSLYRLTDEYSRFYLTWIRKADSSVLNSPGSDYWNTLSGTQRWKTWSGLSFEDVCLKHAYQIKKALGISGVISGAGSWNYYDPDSNEGAQIDLLFDRNDNVISLCEIKCHDSAFAITKPYAQALKKKMLLFKHITKTRKSLLLVFITTAGVRKNSYSLELVTNEVLLDDLFG